LVVLVVAVVVGAGSSVLSARPDLETAKQNVDSSWANIAPALDQRYLQLAAVTSQLGQGTGPVHSLVGEADSALAHWPQLRRQHSSIAAQVAAANDVEAMARRLLVTEAASPRARTQVKVLEAVAKYSNMTTHNAGVDFNQTVQSYEHERRGPLRA